MIKEFSNIKDTFRAVANKAINQKSKGIEDAGEGMFNVTIDDLFGDSVDAIVQCYPNKEYDCVNILTYRQGESQTLELDNLPLILQKEVFARYCKAVNVIYDEKKWHTENVCYGREDLLQVAKQMAADFGNDSVGEDLCGVLADAAYDYLIENRITDQSKLK